MEKETFALEMRRITKAFPGVLANDKIDFKVGKGEIHALLGENGAGKSTAMNILTGLYQADEGEIWINGVKEAIKSPQKALKLGIAMVHQHFRLIQTFSAAENVFLGLSQPKFLISQEAIEKEVSRISKEYGMEIDPQAKIWQLSVGEQQRVEIIKMLYRGVDILIMDEPTAVLTPPEVKELFVTLKRMKGMGKSIIFISHKLDEVMEIADRITVFRRGRNVARLKKADTNKQELASLMVGKAMPKALENLNIPGEKVILSLENIVALSDRNQKALKGISFKVKEGSIFGIAGVTGNGQRELAEVIVGLRKVVAGKIKLLNRDITNKSTYQIIKTGISFIPEERMGTGLVPNMGVADNAILKQYRQSPFCKGFLLQSKEILKKAQEFVDSFDIKTASLETPSRLLSGGNAQKLLLARETSCTPQLIVASHPTRGLDVSAMNAVRKILLQQCEKKVSVVLISEDLDELMSLSDEIAVLSAGEIMKVIPRQNFNREEIGLLMSGINTSRSEVNL